MINVKPFPRIAGIRRQRFYAAGLPQLAFSDMGDRFYERQR